MAFDLEKKGLPTSDDDETSDALLALTGVGWRASEYDASGIHGTFLVVKFEGIPTVEEVEHVRLQIEDLLNSELTERPSRPMPTSMTGGEPG